MFNLVRAEFIKMIQHRWLIGFTMWIFPIGIGILMLVGVVTVLLTDERANTVWSGLRWTEQMMGAWMAPTDLFGQMLPMAFAATWFAGEAQWSTWKHIIPRTRRWKLMTAKIIGIMAIFFIVFNITAFVAAIGAILVTGTANLPLTPPLNSQTIDAFLTEYGVTVLINLGALLFISVLGAIGGLLTRSTLAATLLGFSAFALIRAIIVPLALAMTLLGLPWIGDLYRLTPTYNLDNAKAWLLGGNQFDFPKLTSDVNFVPDSLGFSLVVLAIWISVLVAMMLYIAERRDITS